MDPNANLIEQLKLAERLILDADAGPDNAPMRINPTDALRLAELVQALDGWIRSGGFLPAGWQKGWIRDRSLDPHPITKGRS